VAITKPALCLFGLIIFTACSPKHIRPVSLANTHVRTLRAEKSQIDYQLWISLPEGYATSNERYPVLYLLDPADSFAMAYDIQRDLARFLGTQKIIIVGIGYKDQGLERMGESGYWREFAQNRTRDYIPFPIVDGAKKFDSHTGAFDGLAKVAGHANDFLQFIDGQLIPFIDRGYRTNDHRTLYGQSQGGLFASWVLVRHSGIFNDYIILSPTLWIENERFLKELPSISSESTAGRIYMAVGADEESAQYPMVSNLTSFFDVVSKSFKNRSKLEVLPSENHITTIPTGLTHGLYYLFGKQEIKASSFDLHGHRLHHQSLPMTKQQEIIYKKTTSAVLAFLNQFRRSGENYRDFLARIKNLLVFSYDHPYRTREFCNAFALCRDDYVGVKLLDMSRPQQDEFYTLMQTVLAPYGYEKMKKVFERQLVIHDIEEAYRNDPKKFPVLGGPKGTPLANWKPVDQFGHPLPRDPGDYYIAFFGELEPFINGNLAQNSGFSIRVEGHHLSLNFTFFNDNGKLAVSTSPTFYGSNPMVVPPAPTSAPNEYKNWKLMVSDAFMLAETQVTKLFISALSPQEQRTAHFPHMAPIAFESAAMQWPLQSQEFQRYAKGKSSGLRLIELTGKKSVQKKYLFTELMKLIVSTQRDVFLSIDDITNDMDDMRVSYYGGLGKFDEFYFRAQSEKFLLEMVQSGNFSVVNPGNINDKNDPRNNGLFNNNHVHIMFRDLRNDWGYDPLHSHQKHHHQ